MAETSAGVEIHGHCAKGFEPVREAFAANFEAPGEVGASFSVVQNGEPVVEFWAGHSDAARTKHWSQDTLANVWSTTKGMGALVSGLLIERGEMAYAERVSQYWPEFAANGKERITIGQLLSHQAGLCGPTEPTTIEEMCNQPLMAARLAAQAPLWEPGSRSGYHAITIGVLLGELVKRITGKSIGTYFNEEIAMPFGIDFFIGLPELEEVRVAEMVPAPNASPLAAGDLNPSQVAAFNNPAPSATVPNQRFWRAAELSSANGQGTAAGLARVYGALGRGVPAQCDGALRTERDKLRPFRLGRFLWHGRPEGGSRHFLCDEPDGTGSCGRRARQCAYRSDLCITVINPTGLADVSSGG